jgi:hypothetical protein
MPLSAMSQAVTQQSRTRGAFQLSKQDFAVEDAAEMMDVLQNSKCLLRYDKISHELLSELLVAIATKGEVIGGNNLGSDVRSPTFGLIEVKSRILGTDGPFPRVSLKQRNLDKSSWVAAVRWHRNFTLYDAVMLPKVSVERLFSAKVQVSGTAHIAWQTWISASEALSIRDVCIAAMQTTNRTIKVAVPS